MSLQNALAEAVLRADNAVNQVQTEALEQERSANKELLERLERLATEYSLSEGHYKSEIAELKGRLEREHGASIIMQNELKSEISVIPFRLKLKIDARIKTRGLQSKGGRIIHFSIFVSPS